MFNKFAHKCRICKRKCGNCSFCDKHNKLQSISEREIKNIDCPRCSFNKVVYVTSYIIKRTSIAQRRFKCLKCKMMFTERTPDFRKYRPLWVREHVLILYNKHKGYINKFDSKKKNTYSTREIAKILKISKSFVWSILKIHRITELAKPLLSKPRGL